MAEPGTGSTDLSPVQRQLQRSKKAWDRRSSWDGVCREAYDYVLPNRRPGGQGKSVAPAQMIFDMTGPNSAIHCAGEIQRQIFPAATPFQIETGPLVASRLSGAEKVKWDKQLNKQAEFVYPFMKTGDLDTAMHETCTDLTIGTGALLPLRGPSINDPLRFVCVPFDEIAVDQDAWGRVNYVSWKRQNLGREQILEAWPKGAFTAEFLRLAREKPYDEVVVYQDFWRLPDGSWRFAAYFEKEGQANGFIAQENYRTQPIAVARFYRWPGEAYGRGPVLFALPTIKTANKAQELALKSAAIQLLGIWGFRAGGTFNPDTVRVGPGEFWPMQSTGGLLGPDVQRLDTAAGRLDVGRMVMGDLRSQIREALLDTRIADDGGTPASASEIATRVGQNARVHVGAYGRLIRELLPVIVARSMEILSDWRLLPQLMSFNELLVTMTVNSPMMAALKADELAAMSNYFELASIVAGAPPQVATYIHTLRFLDRARGIMLVPPDVTPTDEERKAADEQQAAAQMAAVAGEAMVKAAPQLAQGMMAEAA